MKRTIEQAILKALTILGASDVSFTVERPGDFAHGDYATNAALVAAKALGKSPREVAEALVNELEGKIDGVKKIDVAGPGFINFTLAGLKVKDIVHEAHEKEWGSNDLYKGKTVMVEYTDPNPFKEFHIGHLMSNAIGESIARVLGGAGAKVVRSNYQGDVGLHVAKAIWGKQQKPDLAWGAAYAYGSTEYEANKEAVDAINKKVYENDSSIAGLYEEGRNYSLEEFEKIYDTLGTQFDKYFFESQSWEVGLELVKKNIGKVFEESEGATVYKGEVDGLHTRVFLTKAGLTTYEAKDLGLLSLKQESGQYDVSITVTASEQQEYFKVVLAAAKKIDEIKDIANKTKHVTHGMMRFAEGKMASRKGNVVTGESLLADLTDASKAKMVERKAANADVVAKQVAVGAIKYSVLKQSSNKDIIFDPEKSLSVEGDSGPYVQYALVRTRSLLRKAADAEMVKPEPSGPNELERLLIHFPGVVEHATVHLEPHFVVTFLTELAGSFNSWYASERLIVDGKITSRNVAVLLAIENTFSKGLTLLGIPTPKEM
jgi:arginyl-tRNA synthetase